MSAVVLTEATNGFTVLHSDGSVTVHQETSRNGEALARAFDAIIDCDYPDLEHTKYRGGVEVYYEEAGWVVAPQVKP